MKSVLILFLLVFYIKRSYAIINANILDMTGTTNVLMLYQDVDDFHRGKVAIWGTLPDGSVRGGAPDEIGSNTLRWEFGGNSSIYQATPGPVTQCFLVVQDPASNPYPDVRCFGSCTYGSCGWDNSNSNTTFMGEHMPISQMPSGTHATKLVQVLSGDAFCALLNTSQIVCWGRCFSGVCGNGLITNIGDQSGEMGDDLLPWTLASTDAAENIWGSLVEARVFVLLKNGTLSGCGLNNVGQLGRGDTQMYVRNFATEARPVVLGSPLGSNFNFSSTGAKDCTNYTGLVDDIFSGGTGASLCIVYSSRTRAKCFGPEIDSLGIGVSQVNGTAEIGSTPGSLLYLPDVCLPSNYTNWRPLNPSNALASTTTCFIGRSTADSVDRLFCYGANTFCDLGIGTNSPQGDSNATCYDNTQVSIGSERVVLGASASETLCYVDSNSLSTIRCQGFNSEFKMNLGGSNESFSQGCDESSMAEGTFNVTTTGLDSYYFMQALDMYPLSGATLTYPVLPLTLSGYNVTSEQTSASSSFNIMCSTDWPCQAWPIVSSSVGTIASYSLQDTCDSILGSNCIFNSSSGYLDCRFWSDLAPTCFPLYYMGAGILGETTLCIESVSGVSYTTGTTGNLCTTGTTGEPPTVPPEPSRRFAYTYVAIFGGVIVFVFAVALVIATLLKPDPSNKTSKYRHLLQSQ